MIDIKAFRNDPQLFIGRLRRKGAEDLAIELVNADGRWTAALQNVEALRAEQKQLGKPSTPDDVARAQRIKQQLKSNETVLTQAEEERNRLLLRIPNPPADDIPDGTTGDDVRVERVVGEPPQLTQPKESLELGRFDMERAARMSGARFGYWIGDTARLALALYRYALDRLAAEGFITVLPPVLVREEALIGTGAFPSDAQNVYEIPEDGLYLSGTAEIPLASLHAGEILDAEMLPLRYVAFSPCFRREAGAAGRDTRGMIRVHQFNKVEQFSLTRPEESWDEHELLLANTEGLVRELGVPYRVVVLPAGDMSAASAKTYDVEIWFPSQNRYRETASISNTTDFQARRLGIRYRDGKSPEPLHMLNGTAVVDRMALAILENFQGDVPDVLRGYGAPERVTP